MAFPVGYLEVGDYEFKFNDEKTLGKFFKSQDNSVSFKVFRYFSNSTIPNQNWTINPSFIIREGHLHKLEVLSFDLRDEFEVPFSTEREAIVVL